MQSRDAFARARVRFAAPGKTQIKTVRQTSGERAEPETLPLAALGLDAGSPRERASFSGMKALAKTTQFGDMSGVESSISCDAQFVSEHKLRWCQL